MFRTSKSAVVLAASAFALAAASLSAQVANPTSSPAPAAVAVAQDGNIFFYKVKVVQRDLDAINYLHRSGSTTVSFAGTDLLPNGKGDAVVKSERGLLTIDAEFRNLTPANGFGPEYLTYVLWAISPDGRPQNLGEVLPAGTKNNIEATTSLQSFALIVTAEPYFSVTTPSDVVVMKNIIVDDQTNGVIEKGERPRDPAAARRLRRRRLTHCHESRHSRREIPARALRGLQRRAHCADGRRGKVLARHLQQGQTTDVKNAADIDASKHRDTKLEITYAREAVQRAEDSRVDTLRKQAAERQANAEQAANNATAQAALSDAQAQAAREATERARLQAENARLQAQQAEMAKANADASAAAANASAAQAANQRADDVTARAAAARERLLQRLNEVLQTSETPRGLVVNLSDVLFDTGKSDLKQATQVSLARVAGILQSYDGLIVQVEGYTDSTGGRRPEPEAVRCPRLGHAATSSSSRASRRTTSPPRATAKPTRLPTTAPRRAARRTAASTSSSPARPSASSSRQRPRYSNQVTRGPPPRGVAFASRD